MSDSSPEQAPASPCVRNCCLDEQDICLGCKRTLQEILDWHRMTTGQKRQLLAELAQRQAGQAPEPPNAQHHKRCFLGLAVSAPVQEILSQAAAAWRRQPDTTAFRWIHPDNYHLTLAFLGQVTNLRLEQLTGLLHQQRWLPEDFTIEIDALVGFPSMSRSRYLVAQVVASPAFVEVHERLQKLLSQQGFPTEQRGFRPHLTLARLRRGQQPPSITPQPLTLAFPAPRLILYESSLDSNGARYQALASFR